MRSRASAIRALIPHCLRPRHVVRTRAAATRQLQLRLQGPWPPTIFANSHRTLHCLSADRLRDMQVQDPGRPVGTPDVGHVHNACSGRLPRLCPGASLSHSPLLSDLAGCPSVRCKLYLAPSSQSGPLLCRGVSRRLRTPRELLLYTVGSQHRDRHTQGAAAAARWLSSSSCSSKPRLQCRKPWKTVRQELRADTLTTQPG